MMTAEEFRQEARLPDKTGKRGIDFGGMKKNEIYIKPEYEKYICHDFSFRRLLENKKDDSNGQ